MNATEFQVLSSDLKRIANQIPLKWGRVQSDDYDEELREKCNIFNIMSLADLERNIADFDRSHKQYYRRRWYLLRCADCDEFLFYCNDNVAQNPVRFDKKWDVRFNGDLQFDVKGTVIPKDYRNQYEDVIADPEQIVQFYYDRQSKGVRYDLQNRLFIVHHSLVDAKREFFLRSAWDAKKGVYERFARNADRINYFHYCGCTSAVLFLVEDEREVLKYMIAGLDNELIPLI